MSRFIGELHNFVSPEGVVFRDVPCRRCGNNLRDARLDSRCPKCKAPIRVSVCGDYLCFASPRWLASITQGILLILGGMLASSVLGIVGMLFFAEAPILRQFLLWCAWVCGLWGAWLMTEPDPRDLHSGLGRHPRNYVRAVIIASMTAGTLLLLASDPHSLLLGDPIFRAILMACCGVLITLGDVAKLHYIQYLATRLPDESLTWHLQALKWALGIGYALMIAVSVTAALLLAGTGMPGHHNIGQVPNALTFSALTACGILPLTVAFIALTVAMLDVLLRSARAIRSQIPVSLDMWRGGHGDQPTTQAVATPPLDPVTAMLNPKEIIDPGPVFPLAAAWNKPADETPVVPLKVAHLANQPIIPPDSSPDPPPAT